MERRYDEDRLRRMRRERRRMLLRRKRRRALFWRAVLIGLLAFVFTALLSAVIKKGEKKALSDRESLTNVSQDVLKRVRPVVRAKDTERKPGVLEGESGEAASYRYTEAEELLRPGGELTSGYAVFVDTQQKTILAGKEERSRMVPASMTKVLTLLVAVERVKDLGETFAVPAEAVDYSFKYRCSCAGFEKGEVVTVEDLLYGTVLPSGAEAAVGLAICAAGSQEAFVELMNEKLAELGLSETAHFTNCVGVYDDNHYCTAYDMAVIMEAALANETCRKVLSARTYLTSATEQHPEGLLLSNWFLRRIEDRDTGGKATAAKTGYVDESGFCAVSYGNDEGAAYICVTAGAANNNACIKDHVWLYKHFSTARESVKPKAE